MSTCHTCELITRRDLGEAPLWDSIHRTAHWDIVHSYNTSLRGWLCLIVRRHIESIADLTEAEAIELGALIRRLSQILQEVTGCAKTYVVQFAEAKEHPHVHFHIIARYADMPDDHRGPNVFKYLGVPDQDRISEAEMNTLAEQIRQRLTA